MAGSGSTRRHLEIDRCCKRSRKRAELRYSRSVESGRCCLWFAGKSEDIVWFGSCTRSLYKISILNEMSWVGWNIRLVDKGTLLGLMLY